MAPAAITPPAIEVNTLESLRNPKPVSTTKTGSKRDIICFSDFDGTIFMQDTGHILFNKYGCGSERRQILDQQIQNGERSFRDVSEEMWGSLDVPFEAGFEVMKQSLDIDCDFQTFHKFCISSDIPFKVISAGLKPVLRRVLDHFLGEEESKHIDIVANDATISPDGSKWTPVWLHDCELGHDKAKSINDFKDSARLQSADGSVPLVVFIGDGVSDLPAAREADVLFARRGLRLEEYCIENGLSYIPFDTFADIQREVIKLAEKDEVKTEEVKELPSTFMPRARMWRRMSSKSAIPIAAVMSPRDEKMLELPSVLSQLRTPLELPRGAAFAAPAA